MYCACGKVKRDNMFRLLVDTEGGDVRRGFCGET